MTLSSPEHNPKVSVIVPVYNVQDYLRQCVDSILAQTFEDYELILVDDGCTDHSGSICDEYETKSDKAEVIHQQNGGLPVARKVGIEHAHGDYILFVDADDWVDPDHLESLITKAEQEQADVVMCGFYFEFPKKKVKFANIPTSLTGKDIIIESLKGSLHAGVVFKLIRRSLFLDHVINFPQYTYLEDMCLSTEILLVAKRIVSTNLVSYHYRYNYHSETNTRDIEFRIRKFEESILNLQELFDHRLLWNDEALKKALYHRINNEKLELLVLPYSARREIRRAYESFDDSWKEYNIRNSILLIPNYIAIRYKRLMIAQIVKHARLLVRKILKGT